MEDIQDFAGMENASAWLRHPVLGDPSFDTFEKVGEAVHRSEPPYEWAVNGSLFRDPKTGFWYCYPGIYHFGYAYDEKAPSDFLIYCSRDEGASWEYLKKGSEAGFAFFSGHPTLFDSHPDVVMTYDADTDRYWLAYDGSTSTQSWEMSHKKIPQNCPRDSGAALAWSESPEGPFYRLDTPVFSNRQSFGRLGKFDRGYATTVLKRQKDWIAFILFDSDRYFSWALGCSTAPSPEGPWTSVQLLLSTDRGEYFPAPVEFYPCFTHGEKVYAPATSVGKNRNYQALFAADLEHSHNPEVWALEMDGNLWHSRPLEDEKYGIWGQTFHGFIHNNTFTVAYPSKDQRNYGTISVASRPWDRPLSDGFVFSGHGGKSIIPLLKAYLEFRLYAELKFTGAVEFIFGYDGILGPNISASDAEPDPFAFASCYALILEENGKYRLVQRDGAAEETIVLAGKSGDCIKQIVIEAKDGQTEIFLNGKPAGRSYVKLDTPLPLAIAAHCFSVMRCTKFQVQGQAYPVRLKYNAWEALLDAGERLSDWKVDTSLSFRSQTGFAGEGRVRGKWNFIGSGVTLYSPKSPVLGSAEIWIDGYLRCVIDLTSDAQQASRPVFCCKELLPGRHCLTVVPRSGAVALDMLEAEL